MISTQRSTSLPGPAQASSSRPSPESANSQNAVPKSSRHSPSSSRHILRNEVPQDEPLITPIIPDPIPKSPSETERACLDETTEPSTPFRQSRIYKPLLDDDVSQYTSISIKDAATEANYTTLEELAHLVRLSTYQVRKRTQTRVRLQRCLVSTALSARLERCGELALRTLVDSFRSDDKKTFSTLYNAIHDVNNSCDAAKRYAVLEPDLEQQKNGRVDESGAHWTFIQEIPPPARETLLNFLTQVRTNTDYLADQICRLSSTELQALTVFHQGLEPVDSVLPFHNRPRNKSNIRSSSHGPSPVERLLSFQRHDPLSALIHTCFANSAGPNSAEHFRRTEIWATVCARLISSEKKVGVDTFLNCVLNIWTAMRQWSGRSSLEWYLMKTLEEGAFLVEKSESYTGIRGHGEPRTAKDSIAAEDFFDSAVRGLFEFVDDAGGEGIPESVLELGNAILRKLDPKRHPGTRLFLVSKWLFHDFLLNAIVHPESHGMMMEYHISEYARQRILKEVALRAGRMVVDLTWKQTAGCTPPPEIKTHIENIMARFKTSRTSRLNPKLLPARSITSLRETAEVRPYLVISPSDLVTMVNAVFPERRPTSGSSDSQFSGFRSTTSSLSGFSMASGPRSSTKQFDTASTISEVESSIFSEVTTSHEPLLLSGNQMGRHAFSSTSISSMSQPQKPVDPIEDEGSRLRQAVREMSHALGSDIFSGSCHPCAEQWAVLFMDCEGKQLSTHMLHDEDDAEDEEVTSSSDSDADVPVERPDLDKDYHQLRDTIVKLVGEFEIPRSANENNDENTFSNRANSATDSRKNRSLRRKAHARPLLPETESKNPYKMYVSAPLADNSYTKAAESAQGRKSVLLDMLEAAEKQCQAQSDFVSSHLYWRTSQQLHSLSSDSLRQNDFVSLLNICSRGSRDSIRRSAAAIEEYDAWLVWLKQSQERHDGTTEAMIKRCRALRDKMWYVTDVRNSAPYGTARLVVLALRAMGFLKTNKKPLSATSRGRNLNRSSASNYFGKAETEFLDLLAASDEHGGPNKLSDAQSDTTWKWLSQFGIENFCKGEERIHRFCLELDSCISKLVGDGVMDAPVLWSSELYSRDKRFLDSGRQNGDLALDNFGGLSLYGDNNSDHGSIHSPRSSRGIDFSASRPSGRDLRSVSMRNSSQQSFDSSRWGGSSRMSVSGGTIDSPDYFGHASPVLSIDTTATFWSPFQNRLGSPTPSVRSFRPGTSSTGNDTVMDTVPDSDVPSKLVFLTELKQTLNALLLSDLGSLVFSRGSETDSWFSGELGQDCMDRKAGKDKKEKSARREERRRSRRGLEPKDGRGDLRLPHDKKNASPGGVQLEKTSSRGSSHPSNNGTSTPEHHSRTNSFAIVDSQGSTFLRQQIKQQVKESIKETLPTDFPYKKAFRKLLTMFSVHPNPYIKLNALFELEHLVIASLTTVPRRRPKVPGPVLSPTSPVFEGNTNREPSFNVPRAKNVGGEAIDNCKERRSHAISDGSTSPTTCKAERAASSPIATTDMIVDVLQNLFREQGMRPKTLFRDLQYIAAFIPASVLDKTDRGKAFWDAELAALGLKQEVCRTMIELADEIVKYHTSSRGPASHVSNDTSSLNGEEGESMALYSMADAAKMWTITAREGDPVAERELAIFYLTHPELVEKTMLPLARPREVFRSLGSGQREGDERSDPATMCVAFHWMEASRQGGDEVAKTWMDQRAEMVALPDTRR